jgi:hypothetical protein
MKSRLQLLIKKKIKKFKNLDYSVHCILHYHNNKKKNIDIKYYNKYGMHVGSKQKPSKTSEYNKFICPENLVNIYTIYIFLDVDENLKNEGVLNFYKPLKTLKKNIFGIKRKKTEYKEKNNFIPKTGDIIYVSGKTYHKFEDIKEKNKEIETKNRIFLEISLCLTILIINFLIIVFFYLIILYILNNVTKT